MQTTDWLKIDANEGRCVLDRAQLESLLSADVARLYPQAELLEKDLAAFFGVERQQVIATAGADDAIERTFRAFAGSGAPVLSTTPGFVEFLDASARAKARFVSVWKKPGGPFPAAAFCAAIASEKPALAVIASPDNPAGTVLDPEDFKAISAACRAAGSLFLLDVTYIDFADEASLFPLALKTPGVLVTGSFSKSRGLAGFRAGWAIAGADETFLIKRLREEGPPFSLSSPAIEAARLALAKGGEAYALFVRRVREERAELREILAAMGAETWASQANFVSALVPDAAAFALALKRQGILVRHWPGNRETAHLVRITCPGDRVSFDRLKNALKRMEALSWTV